MARGTLRVYLGAAPGVGKTFAMLDEGYRRQQRGADVVVAFVETHGRANTIAQLRDLEVMPRKRIEYRDASFEEMDLEGLLARAPQVALVDELAHTNVPGSRNQKRWQDVEVLLDAGIDVVSTVNIQHLESLNDVVEKITGITQKETVPDDVVRRADQIELVDMSPEALRRRMAHGNIYPAERIDAALANYFRAGNLGALRELALLWAADRVEDALDDYRERQGITATWETRERVVVAVTGAPGGEALIRRAARIAARARGAMIGVHVVPTDGLRRGGGPGLLERHRDLVAQLGGSYHEVGGDDVARALVNFARSKEATQIVLGATGRSPVTQVLRGSIVNDVLREASGIDVHVIAAGADDSPRLPRHVTLGALPLRRQLAGWLLLVAGLPLFTVFLSAERAVITLPTDLLLYLALVVAAGAVGGVLPALVGAVVGSLLANYFLVPPIHTFTIGNRENFIALLVFIAVAATVSGYVNLAARRAQDARRARAEAEALARSTATLAGAADPLPLLVDHLFTTFGVDGAAVLERDNGGWRAITAAGRPPTGPAEGESLDLDPTGRRRLVLVGGQLTTDDLVVLRSHADQLALALTARELQAELAHKSAIEQADALRAALLQAVSHDLRTPLAGIKASVSSLLSEDVTWDRATEHEFLTTIDSECDRLTRLLSNLLDMSRLQAGAFTLNTSGVAIDDLVSSTLSSLSWVPDNVVVALPEHSPSALVDPALVERALANVVANAIKWSPPDQPVRIEAAVVGDAVHVRVVDRGPGIPADMREHVIRPFQRLGDNPSSTGTGLGLAVAHGFVAAVGGEMVLDDTPGGGLTVDIALPLATNLTDEETDA